MRFLHIKIKGCMNDLIYALRSMEHDVEFAEECCFNPYSDNIEESYRLSAHLKNNKYDYAISLMYSSDVSNICKDCGLKYISWIFDSPAAVLYDCSAQNDNNHIFVFDRIFYSRLKKENRIPNLYYLPLGACMPRINAVNITEADEKKYYSDISFVGNLYENNQYDLFKEFLSDQDKEAMKKYCSDNVCSWHSQRYWPLLNVKTTQVFEEAGYFSTARTFGMNKQEYLGVAIMARKLAQMDRILLLNELAKTEKVRLYTKSSANLLENVEVCGPVDYETDMTTAFFMSKINLNITIPSIESGLPQRVWDIIGSGGFCMTNYQSEVEEYFVIGEDIETFLDFDELKEKTRFYLEHEDIRMKILVNGYKKVSENHSYVNRVNEMIRVIEQ